MMKRMKKRKIVISAMLLALIIMLSACSNSQSPIEEDYSIADTAPALAPAPESQSAGETVQESSLEPSSAGSNILIVYFSRHGISDGSYDTDADAVSSASLTVGHTIVVAEMVQELTGGDMFQIETVEMYPKGYDDVLDVGRAQLENGERPELATHVDNMDDYDVIILGYPKLYPTV